MMGCQERRTQVEDEDQLRLLELSQHGFEAKADAEVEGYRTPGRAVLLAGCGIARHSPNRQEDAAIWHVLRTKRRRFG